MRKIHSNLCNITSMATKVHMIFMRFVVLTWKHEHRDINVACDIMFNTK